MTDIVERFKAEAEKASVMDAPLYYVHISCAEAREVVDTIEALRAKNARLCGVIGRLVNTVEYFNSTHKAGEARDIVAEARAEMDSDND